MTVTIHRDRAAWLASRAGEANGYPIGASDVAAVLGMSPYRTPYEVWEAHHAPRPQVETPEMADGTRWEASALRLVDVPADLCVHIDPLAVAHHACGWLRATPDAWMLDIGAVSHDDVSGLIEVKTDRTPGALDAWPADQEVTDWRDGEEPPIRLDYWLQCQAQMACTGARWVDLHVWIPQPYAMPTRRIYRVHPSARWPAIFEAVAAWREVHLVGGDPPEPQTDEERERLARWRYPTPSVRRPATDDEADAIRDWLDAREERDACERTIAEARGKIATTRGDAQTIYAPGVGRWTISKNGAQRVEKEGA